VVQFRVITVCCVAFWFTKSAGCLRGFVGKPNRHEPWVNKLKHNRRVSKRVNQKMVLLLLVGTRES
jgi:hypothetical protein